MTCYGGREKVGRGLPRTRSRFRLFSAVTDFLWLYHLRLPANACMEVLHAFEVRRRGGGMDREREREREYRTNSETFEFKPLALSLLVCPSRSLSLDFFHSRTRS